MPGEQLEDRQHVSRAFGFSAANQVVNRIVTFGSGIIIMRILLPGDVGTFAAATAIVVFCTAFNDLCMGQAIIQWKGDLRAAVRTGITVSLAGSLILFGIVFALAPYFGEWLNDDKLTSVLRLSMLLVIIDGVGTTPVALLTRTMRQKAILGIETVSLIAQIFITVVLALGGFGAYALVWGMLASNALTALLMFIIAPETGRPAFDWTIAKQMIRYGSTIAASNIFRVGTQYCDNLVVGVVNGTKQLGYYQLGYNGGNLPENTIGATVGRVSFAWFSQIRENFHHRNKAFHDLTLGLVATTLPFVMFLSVLSKDIVLTLYGEKWLPAAEIVRILAILGGARVFLNFFADIFAADGHPLIEFKTFVLWCCALVPALIVGAHIDGIRGVAIAHVLVAIIIITPFVLRKLAHKEFPLTQLGKDSIIFVIGAVAQGITMYAISQFISSPFWTVLFAGAAGALVFALITFKKLIVIKKTFTQADHGFTEVPVGS